MCICVYLKSKHFKMCTLTVGLLKKDSKSQLGTELTHKRTKSITIRTRNLKSHCNENCIFDLLTCSRDVSFLSYDLSRHEKKQLALWLRISAFFHRQCQTGEVKLPIKTHPDIVKPILATCWCEV